jgi:hypothetical protein
VTPRNDAFAASGPAADARRRRAWEWAAVAAVFVSVVAVAAIWLAIDRHPPEWDYANHLESAVLCRRDLAARDLAAVFARSSFYPPLVPCAAGLVYRLLPSDVVFGEVVILAFLGLGMAATYVLGRHFGGGAAGVVAATLFGTAPAVVNQALRFQLDVPLASMVAAFLAALLAADRFEHRGWTIVTGFLLGLGMLTKPPFFVYVAPACLLVLAGTRRRRAWLHAAVAVVVGVLVALPWYGPRAFGLSTQIQNRSFKQAAEAGFPAALSPASLAYYPLGLPSFFGLIAVLLLVAGVGVALRRRCWFVLAGLAPLVVFLLLQNKQIRYALPLLPMMAVAGGLGFAALPTPGRWVAAVGIVAAATFQISSTAFAVPAVARLPLVGVVPTDPAPPSRLEWPHRAILDLIVRDSGGAPRTVSVVPNHPHFSPANFRYYAVRDGLRLRVARAWDGEPVGIQYMILKTGELGPPWTIDKARRVGERLTADPSLARVFPVIGEFPLPDGSTASVRARRLPADLDVTPEALARAVTDALRVRLGEVMRDVEGLEVRLDYDARILTGRIQRLEIAAAGATVGELRRRRSALLRLRNVRLVVNDALVNPWSALREGRFDPLDAGRLTIERATIDAADLQSFVDQVRGLRRMSLSLGAGFVDLAFGMPGPDVAARVQLVATTDRPFALAAERVTIGGVPAPSLLVNWIMRSFDPSRGIASRLPFPATIHPVTVTPSAVRIGAP